MSEREKPHSAQPDFLFRLCTRLFRDPSLTRQTHAEPPVNELTTNMSVGHCVGYATTTKLSAVRSGLPETIVYFLVDTVAFKYRPVSSPDH